MRHLLSSLSQLVTLPFQSQVCLSKSKASPLGHVICFSPDLVHLGGRQPTAKMFIFERNNIFFTLKSALLFFFFCLSNILSSQRIKNRLQLVVPSPPAGGCCFSFLFLSFFKKKEKKAGEWGVKIGGWLLTLELVAVLDVGLPVAGLALDVEGQAGRALDRREPRHADLGRFVAPIEIYWFNIGFHCFFFHFCSPRPTGGLFRWFLSYLAMLGSFVVGILFTWGWGIIFYSGFNKKFNITSWKWINK